MTADASCVYLKAVLVRHELLCFPLVGGLRGAPRRLGGRDSSAGAASALREVEVCYLDTDLIAHDVLELDGEKELS